jgi:hypothetical protein
MRREADEDSVISSGSGDRAPEVLQIGDDYANQVRRAAWGGGVHPVRASLMASSCGCVSTSSPAGWL